MGVIQNSINSSLGTAAAAMIGAQHIKNQEMAEISALPEQIIAGKEAAKALTQDIKQIEGEQQSLEAEVSGEIAKLEGRSPRYEGRNDVEYIEEVKRLDKAMKTTEALQKAQEMQTQMKLERFKSLTNKWGGKK